MSEQIVQGIGFAATLALVIGGVHMIRNDPRQGKIGILMVVAALVLGANLLILWSFPD